MRHLHWLQTWFLLAAVLLPATVCALYTGDTRSPEAEYDPTQLIVKFRPDAKLTISMEKDGLISTGLPAVDELHATYSVKSHRRLLRESVTRFSDHPLRNVYLLTVQEGTDLETMMQDYRQLDAVEYAHPDYQVELYDAPDDPLYPHQWALNNTGQGYYHVERIDGDNNDTLAIVYGTPDADIDAGEVYDSPPDATNIVVVAIVDTGVDWDHPDLAGMMWNNPGEIPDNGLDDDHNGYVDDVVGWDFAAFENPFAEEDNDPTDTYGHGTHCAGIVAATINNATGVAGVVPAAKIMGLKCNPAMTISVLIKGIIYASDNGADVINMS